MKTLYEDQNSIVLQFPPQTRTLFYYGPYNPRLRHAVFDIPWLIILIRWLGQDDFILTGFHAFINDQPIDTLTLDTELNPTWLPNRNKSEICLGIDILTTTKEKLIQLALNQFYFSAFTDPVRPEAFTVYQKKLPFLRSIKNSIYLKNLK
jgi:hypothetical protein